MNRFSRAIGLVLHLRRRELGLTPMAVAEKSGVSQPDLSSIERGIVPPTSHEITTLCSVLDISPVILYKLRDISVSYCLSASDSSANKRWEKFGIPVDKFLKQYETRPLTEAEKSAFDEFMTVLCSGAPA